MDKFLVDMGLKQSHNMGISSYKMEYVYIFLAHYKIDIAQCWDASQRQGWVSLRSSGKYLVKNSSNISLAS